MRAYLGGQAAQAQRPVEAADQRGGPDFSIAGTPRRLGAEGATANNNMLLCLKRGRPERCAGAASFDPAARANGGGEGADHRGVDLE
eukprot:145337-Pyramimonas_sp.AAC.1